MLVFNLLDNAHKYSPKEHPTAVSVAEEEGQIVLRIADEGPGIAQDELERIFEKFYRAHTGNLHNVKGFGLGLSYVKAMVEAHEGDINAESTLGKGSTFTIDLPLKKV